MASRLVRYLEREDHGEYLFGSKAPEPQAVDFDAIKTMFDSVDSDRDGMISRQDGVYRIDNKRGG